MRESFEWQEYIDHQRSRILNMATVSKAEIGACPPRADNVANPSNDAMPVTSEPVGGNDSTRIMSGNGDNTKVTTENEPTQAQEGELQSSASNVESTHEQSVHELSTDMFQKVANYLQGEMIAVCDDYQLLEAMNRETTTKYSDMKTIAGNIGKTLGDLNEKYRSLEPVLKQIDQVEENVASLEQAAYRLDAYSKRLDSKMKQLEKR